MSFIKHVYFELDSRFLCIPLFGMQNTLRLRIYWQNWEHDAWDPDWEGFDHFACNWWWRIRMQQEAYVLGSRGRVLTRYSTIKISRCHGNKLGTGTNLHIPFDWACSQSSSLYKKSPPSSLLLVLHKQKLYFRYLSFLVSSLLECGKSLKVFIMLCS